MKDIKNEGLLENLDEFKEESEKDLNNFSIIWNKYLMNY